jgi:HK97 family phage major capsid protein
MTGGEMAQAARVVVNASQATGMARDDWVSVFFALAQERRASPGCRWLMNASTLGRLVQAWAYSGEVFLSKADFTGPVRLMGVEIVEDGTVAPVGPGARSVVLADVGPGGAPVGDVVVLKHP